MLATMLLPRSHYEDLLESTGILPIVEQTPLCGARPQSRFAHPSHRSHEFGLIFGRDGVQGAYDDRTGVVIWLDFESRRGSDDDVPPHPWRIDERAPVAEA